MGDATAKVFLETILRGDEDVRKEIQNIAKDVMKVGKNTQDVSKKSGGFLSSMQLAWAAVAAAVYKVIGFAREAVADAVASDRQMRQLAQTYSGMGDEAKKMASEIGKAFAMQDDDVAALLARLGTLLQNMGLTKAEALEMSGAMVRVGADLAHFWGKSTEEAVGAIQAALTGNGRALKQFGMDVDEASIKQQALTMGIGDGKRALTQAETAMAAMALVTKSAGNAIGSTAADFNTFEMQAKRAGVIIQEIKESIGRGLMTGLSPSLIIAGRDMDRLASSGMSLETIVGKITSGFLALVRGIFFGSAQISVSILGKILQPLAWVADKIDNVKREFWNMVRDIGVAAGKLDEFVSAVKANPANIVSIAKNFVLMVEDTRAMNDQMAGLGDTTKKTTVYMDWLKKSISEARQELVNASRVEGPMEGPQNNPLLTQTSAAAPRGNAFVSMFGVTEEDLRNAGTTYEEMLLSNEETWQDIEEAHIAEEDRIRDERVQKEMQALSTQAQYWSQYLTQIGNLVSQYSDARAAKEIANIDKERDKRIAAYDAMLAAGTLTEEEYQRKRTEVEEEAEREIHQVKLRAFRAEKQGKMMSTVMAGALAVIQAFAQLGPIGGAIASLIIAGITAAQLSLINQQTMPEYAQGGIAGLNGPEVALVGERGPELIVPATRTAQLMASGAGGGGITFGKGSINISIAMGTPTNVERGVYNAIRKLSDDQGRRNVMNG